MRLLHQPALPSRRRAHLQANLAACSDNTLTVLSFRRQHVAAATGATVESRFLLDAHLSERWRLAVARRRTTRFCALNIDNPTPHRLPAGNRPAAAREAPQRG